jgi:hypothetical protein
MKFIAAAALLAGAASAAPTTLETRAITGPTKNYNCDGMS